MSYRATHNELSKYIAWFGLVMGSAQGLLAIPPFFTLDHATLRDVYVVGELLIYCSGIAQAAIVWCLMLRPYFPIYVFTLPIAAIGLFSWIYAVPRATLSLANNFITYLDPPISTWIVALLFIGLFVPVGLYFIYTTLHQPELKARLTSLVLGLVYIGIGFSTGGHELLTREVISPSSAIGNLVFFCILLVVIAWPRKAPAKLPVQVASP